MCNIFAVQEVDCAQNLLNYVGCIVLAKLLDVDNAIKQLATLQVLCGDVKVIAIFEHFDDFHDVRMVALFQNKQLIEHELRQ